MKPLPFLAAFLISFACRGAAPEKLKVTTFSTILTEVAQAVGGDRVEVIGELTWENNPHEYQLTEEAIKAAAASDLVLICGKHMEEYESKLTASPGAKKRVIEVGVSMLPVPVGNVRGEPEDAHWWQSVPNVQRAARVMRDAFGALRPNDKTYFAANEAKYTASLEDLQKWVKSKVAEVTQNHRKLITTYDGFSYFAKEYGFQILRTEGLSTGDNPNSKDVVELVKLLKQQRVKAVFADAVENPLVIEALQKEAGAKYGVPLNLEGVGEGEQGTYRGMMRYNVTTIIDALK